MNVSDAKVVMLKGEKGSDIAGIEKTASDKVVDSYTITLTNGEKHTFNVTNGSSIASIKKTGSSGLTDTYTVTLTNDDTTTFNVTNGNGIVSIEKTSTNALVDTYTINYSNGSYGTFSVTNGRGIVSIEKTSSSGINDTYTITYNDGTTSTYNVVNADAKELTDKFDLLEGMTTGKFVSGTACVAGNYYIADDKLYKCIANTDGSIPVTNTAYFKQTTVMNELNSRMIKVDVLFDVGYTPIIDKLDPDNGRVAYSHVMVDFSKYAYISHGEPTQSTIFSYEDKINTNTISGMEHYYQGQEWVTIRKTDENGEGDSNGNWITFEYVYASADKRKNIGDQMEGLQKAICGIDYRSIIKKTNA